jgi:hypothetical protein
MVACIVNFAVGAKDSGSDLGSSIGCAIQTLLLRLLSFSHASKLLYLHHTPILLAVVQVNHFRCCHEQPSNPALRPIYNGYMKVCLFHIYFERPGG